LLSKEKNKNMEISKKTIETQTKEQFDIIDLTEKVKSFVKEGGVKNGLINIQTLHTTTAVFVQEKEPLLLQDIKKYLERIVPQSINYNHDDFDKRTVNVCEDECRNGHSHCKALGLPTSVTLNLINGEVQLGRWQSILFIELDRARNRKIQVQIIGE